MLNTPINPQRLPGPNSSVSVLSGSADGGKDRWAGEIAIGLIIRSIRRHVLVFGIVTGFVMAAAYLVLRTPPIYTATAVVRLAGERQAAGVDEATRELDRNSGPVLSLVQRLRSRTVAGPVIDSLGRQLQPIDNASFWSEWLTGPVPPPVFADVQVNPDTPPDTLNLTFLSTEVVASHGRQLVRAAYGAPLRIGPARFRVASRLPVGTEVAVAVIPRDVAIDNLLLQLAIVPVTGTDALQVKYTDADPALAQQVANLVVRTFLASAARAAQEQAGRRRLFLSGQLAEADSLLRAAQGRLSAFRSRQELGTTTDKMGLQQEAMMSLDSRRGDLEADRRVYQALLSQLESPDSTVREEGLRSLAYTPEVAGDRIIERLYGQLLTYRTRLDSMTAGPWRNSTANPDVVQLTQLLSGTEQDLVRAVRAHLASMTERLSALSDLRASSEGRLQALPGLQAEEMRLDQQVASLSELADQLRLEVQKSRMSEQLAAVDVDVVDLASRPYLPVGVPWWAKAGLALILGLLVGTASSTMLDLHDRSVRAPEEMERALNVPGLGIIPKLREASSTKSPLLGLRDRLISGPRARVSSIDRRMPVLGIDAFRLLYSNLTFGWDGGHRTILVTSVGPKEGKTLVATNLAFAFVREGARVLLVDCDVRRARLHEELQVAREPGLMELLAPERQRRMESVTPDPVIPSPRSTTHSYSFLHGVERTEVRLDKISPTAEAGGTPGSNASNGAPVVGTSPDPDRPRPLPRNVKPTAMPGLFVLPSGALPANPALALRASAVGRLLRIFSEQFDLIIIDTPPVLVGADAPMLAPLADDVLLVVRAGQTSRDGLDEVARQLAAVGAHVVGAVLNDPSGKVARRGSKYYTYDYYATAAE